MIKINQTFLFQLGVLYKTNWSADMKELFADIDAQNVFSTKSVCNFDLIEDKMLAQMITSWKHEDDAKPKPLFRYEECHKDTL